MTENEKARIKRIEKVRKQRAKLKGAIEKRIQKLRMAIGDRIESPQRKSAKVAKKTKSKSGT